MEALWSSAAAATSETDAFVSICAPMVRYSRLPFRLTVRSYGCDLAFTPMIVADSFARSMQAAQADFMTCEEDRPLGVQFAATDPEMLWLATERVAHLVDIVDLNCGCPQRWAIQEGIGSALLRRPQTVKEMVATLRRRCSLPLSVKIRLDNPLTHTADLVRNALMAGVDVISVHARTAKQRSSEPADWEAAALVAAMVRSISGGRTKCVLNGDVFSREDACNARKRTGCDGVMSARGILENPALFSGAPCTPDECFGNFLRSSIDYALPLHLTHQHCVYMLQNKFFGATRKEFNELRSAPAMFDWLREHGLY